MSLWFSESELGQVSYQYKIKNVLFSEQSEFQKVEVVDTVAYGKMLVIDGCVMITDVDEFVYHELISHVPACLHKDPKKIVVIGGGDGGTVRELIKHEEVESVTLCEIDQMVIDTSKQFFPDVACALDHPKVTVRVGDGIDYVKSLNDEVDIIIVDSTDPIGPGEGLFTGAFYQSVRRALKSDGVMVAQSESPWYGKDMLGRIQNNIRRGFKNIYPYIGHVPTYPRGMWSWTLASNHEIDPNLFDRDRFRRVSGSLSYLSEGGFGYAFSLPPFFKNKIQ